MMLIDCRRALPAGFISLPKLASELGVSGQTLRRIVIVKELIGPLPHRSFFSLDPGAKVGSGVRLVLNEAEANAVRDIVNKVRYHREQLRLLGFGAAA